MMTLTRLFALAALAVGTTALPVVAQSTSELKRELKTKEADAKDDADALFEVAQWAREKGLEKEADKLLDKVLEANPDHVGANEALGNVKHEGEWLPAADAKEKRVKALEAEYKKQGLVKNKGVWIEKDHKDDAKFGIYHHDGIWVTRDEKIALMEGMVRHPRTGVLIDPYHAERAATLFEVRGEWVDEKAADKAHRRKSDPWVLHSDYCTIVGHLPIETLEPLKLMADQAVQAILPFFDTQPFPAERPVILVAKDTDQYREFGNQFGGAGSAHGAFLAEAPVEMPNLGTVSLACANWGEDAWKEYYFKHAVGMAYAASMARSAQADKVPLWFIRGMGAKCSRLANGGLATYFAKQTLNIGGIQAPGAFFNGFAISGDMTANDIDKAIFQAGMTIDFAAKGGQAAVTDAMQLVTQAFASRNGRAVEKALEMLEKQVRAAEDAVDAYFKSLLKG